MAGVSALKFLEFLLGLLVGLVLLGWQRSQLNRKLRLLLQDLTYDSKSPLSPVSRLTIAIAHHKQRYQQLEQQIETWKQVLHAAPIGYLQVDDENQLIWCNQQARQLLGIPQLEYRYPRLLLELVRSYELDHLIEQSRDVQSPCVNEWLFHPASLDPANLSQPQAYPIRGYGFPLSEGDVGVFLENRLEAATLAQQRDRWTSDVAHELKTPLTSIRLVAETLQPRLEPPLKKWIDRLLNEVIRLSNLVQDLLDLSQLERGTRHCLNLKTVDLAELIQSTWVSLEPLARKKQLQLSYRGPAHLLIQVDEPRFYRVLINLLDNSIKYSPPRQIIQVQVTIEDRATFSESASQQVHLEVIDAGPGFPEHALSQVFERFYRADPSRARSVNLESSPTLIENSDTSWSDTSPQRSGSANPGGEAKRANSAESGVSGGSGLGLAIVRQIVEAHQGIVSASNHPVTGGAWLQVFLPYQPPLPQPKN